MTIKELIKELEKYNENDEIKISIANKTENRIEVRKENGKVVISEANRVIIERLKNEVFNLRIEMFERQINQYINTIETPTIYKF